jgi:hypothetical protein
MNEFHICWFQNVCRWFRAKSAAKWQRMIQDTTFRQIREWHVLKYGLEGAPEQGTDITEGTPRANNKWARRQPIRTRRRSVGPTRGQPTTLVGRWPSGPHRLKLPRGTPWLAPEGGLERLGCSSPRGSPIYMRGECKWEHTPHLTLILFLFLGSWELVGK